MINDPMINDIINDIDYDDSIIDLTTGDDYVMIIGDELIVTTIDNAEFEVSL